MKGEIVSINRYWDDIACEFKSQIVVDLPDTKHNFKLGEIGVKQ
jgi:hypothetical protein